MITAAVSFIFGAFFGLFVHRFWYRVVASERCILDLLAASPGPMHGLDMVNTSGGLLKRGTVYVLLGRLEDRGLIESYQGYDGRRKYKIASPSTKATKP